MTTVVIIQLQCKKKHSHIKWLCFRKVEARRIELLSKHILQKLSTCLFHFEFSGINWEPSFAGATEDKMNNRLIP